MNRQFIELRAPLVRTTLLLLLVLSGIAESADPNLVWSREQVVLPPRDTLHRAPIVGDVAVSPAGDRIAIAGDDHLVRIWDLSQKAFVAELAGHSDWVRALQYSPDGTLLATAGDDGNLIVWDLRDGQVYRRHAQQQAIMSVAFDPRGGSVATIGFRSPLSYYEIASGTLQQTLRCPCEDMRAVAISPNGHLVAGGGRNGKIRVWETATGETVTTYKAHGRRIHGVEFSPDGMWVASCGDDQQIHVARVDRDESFQLRGPRAKFMALTFCGPSYLAVGGSDNRIRIWNLDSRTEEMELEGHTGTVAALAYANGTLVSAGFDTKVWIWRRSQNVAGDRRAEPLQVGDRGLAVDAG